MAEETSLPNLRYAFTDHCPACIVYLRSCSTDIGQIFCSRCASNIIKATRFGADGMLRVCNLCLRMLEEEDNDDDDRRSVGSIYTGFPPHQLDLLHSHSPYSTTHMYAKSEEPYNLFPIGESRRKEAYGDDGSAYGSRPPTPGEQTWNEPSGSAVPPPFRRGLLDDDKETGPPETLESIISASPSMNSVRAPMSPAPHIPFPTRDTKAMSPMPGLSTIQFPGSPSSSDGNRSPHPLRSRFNSYATEYDPMARARRQSKMDVASTDADDDEWRVRRESSAYVTVTKAGFMTPI